MDSSGADWNHLSADENDRALSPPDTAAITVDHNAVTGYALVSADEGAVHAGTGVMVANLELGNV
ncbi:MAG: hypothetical protein QF728_09455, partial [Arenicellales bacterium]|nr:hypothetical protein [Arenicellales bacterium]